MDWILGLSAKCNEVCALNSEGQTLRTYEAETLTLVCKLGRNKFVGVTASNLLQVFDVNKETPLFKTALPKEKITAVVATLDESVLMVGTEKGSIFAWELPSGLLLREFKAHLKTIVDIRLSDDSSLVFSCSVDGSTHIYTLSSICRIDNEYSVKPINTIKTFVKVEAMAISTFTSRSTRDVKLTLKGDVDPQQLLTPNTFDGFIALSYANFTIFVHKISDLSVARKQPITNGRCTAMVFSMSSMLIIGMDTGKLFYIYLTGREADQDQCLPLGAHNGGQVESLTITNDGLTLLSSSKYDGIRMFLLTTMQFTGHIRFPAQFCLPLRQPTDDSENRVTYKPLQKASVEATSYTYEYDKVERFEKLVLLMSSSEFQRSDSTDIFGQALRG